MIGRGLFATIALACIISSQVMIRRSKYTIALAIKKDTGKATVATLRDSHLLSDERNQTIDIPPISHVPAQTPNARSDIAEDSRDSHLLSDETNQTVDIPPASHVSAETPFARSDIPEDSRDSHLLSDERNQTIYIPPASHVPSQTPSTAHNDVAEDSGHDSDNDSSRSNSTVKQDSFYCIQNATRQECCDEQHCDAVRKSTLYSACCGNTPNQDSEKSRLFPLYVAATPRSGTVFMSQLMRELGVPLANDAQMPTEFGMVSWVHCRNDTRYDLPWSRSRDIHHSKFFAMFHQVRDPLKSITSMAFTEGFFGRHYERYLLRHISLIPEAELKSGTNGTHLLSNAQACMHRAMEFYVQWHQLLIDLRLPLIRLEDVIEGKDFSAINSMFTIVGRPVPNPEKLRHVASQRVRRLRQQQEQRRRSLEIKHNQRQHRDTVQWEELCEVNQQLTEQFFQMVSQHFGYYTNMTSACAD